MKDPTPYQPRKGKRSVVLLSGGLDSAVALVQERLEGAKVFCLSARYGQRNSLELLYAKRLAEKYGASDHRIVDLPMNLIGRSPLVGAGEIPCRTLEEIRNGPSPAYVPARNTILLSMGLALAETMECDQLHIAVNRGDAEGFPDCRFEYIIAWHGLGKYATRTPVTIQAPFLTWPKYMIVQLAVGMYKMDLSETLSCYQPVQKGGPHCGRCDACTTRIAACERAEINLSSGWKDPTVYAADL